MRRLGLTLLLAGCAGGAPVTVSFEARVGGEPLRCDGSYAGVGAGGATIRPADLRMYVHDVRLVLDDGSEEPVTLDEVDAQSDGLALVDFEDGTGTCETGSPGTWTSVTGTAAGAARASGIVFKVGVPEDRNHLDAAVAPAPLDQTGMWWSWSGGYRYLKLDVLTDAVPGYVFHLGATGCDGTPGSGFTCAAGNVAEVRLDGWTPDRPVVLDVAELLADLDLDAPLAEDDLVPGCMSSRHDPECPAMFAAMGLALDSGEQTGAPPAFSLGDQ
ncbi:MAG TPA: metallo-mystery pair system four-Cys motif protein [Myxococcota bacterium]|nr:metallo-mystery pair system four-Cys motif protein [Myxococcota bacterium]